MTPACSNLVYWTDFNSSYEGCCNGMVGSKKERRQELKLQRESLCCTVIQGVLFGARRSSHAEWKEHRVMLCINSSEKESCSLRHSPSHCDKGRDGSAEMLAIFICMPSEKKTQKTPKCFNKLQLVLAEEQGHTNSGGFIHHRVQDASLCQCWVE